MSYSSGLFYELIISIVHIMHFTLSLNLPSCRHCRVGFLASWSWKLRPTLHYPLSNRTLYSATLVKYSQRHYIATAKTRVQNVQMYKDRTKLKIQNETTDCVKHMYALYISKATVPICICVYERIQLAGLEQMSK